MIDTDAITDLVIDTTPREDMRTYVERTERERGIDIPDLMRRADRALREEADAEGAEARERLLDVYRRRQRAGLLRDDLGRSWPPEDIAALRWICHLADEGHVGAARLRDRIVGLESRGPDYVRQLLEKPVYGAP
jgi:hypothetical protein